MDRDAEALLKEALTLSELDRAEVAGALLNSLEPEGGTDIESMWRGVVAHRVAALDAGEVDTVAWDEIRDRLFGSLPTASSTARQKSESR